MIKHLCCSSSSSSSSSSSYQWNIQLKSLTATSQHAAAISLYKLMLHPPNPPPNTFTFPSILRSSAAAATSPLLTSQLHSHAVKLGCLSDPHVNTSLISSYSRHGPSLLPLARSLLRPSLPASFNSLISAYALHSQPLSAFSLFRTMLRSSLQFNSVTVLSLLPSLPSPISLHSLLLRSGMSNDTSVANCVLTSYSKSGDTDLARNVFDEMPDRDVVSYNAMITGYAQNGLATDVLELYDRFRELGRELRPDPVTLVGVLSACANLGAHSVGRDVERVIDGNPRFCSNVFLKNALINMHARCGDLDKAREIFCGMTEKSIVSWTAIIAGYGTHGHGSTAVRLFDRMLGSGVRPDGVVIVSVLSACSHSGLTDKGMEYFSNMEIEFGIKPGPEHYACVVDLLGRAGRLKDAWELIGSMPVKPDGGVWGALLGACKIHRDVRFGELAFERLVELEPANVGYYVLLSNIYLDAGILDGVARVRAMMRKRGLKKDPGCSYVELDGKVHLFMADDHSHPLAKSIYQMIGKLEGLVKGESGEEGEGSLKVVGFHSEKLAVAFGLLSTETGVEILVIKNLRVCEACHLFMKLVSRIVHRKMVVRDASRFHHFEGGVCSCNDYW